MRGSNLERCTILRFWSWPVEVIVGGVDLSADHYLDGQNAPNCICQVRKQHGASHGHVRLAGTSWFNLVERLFTEPAERSTERGNPSPAVEPDEANHHSIDTVNDAPEPANDSLASIELFCPETLRAGS